MQQQRLTSCLSLCIPSVKACLLQDSKRPCPMLLGKNCAALSLHCAAPLPQPAPACACARASSPLSRFTSSASQYMLAFSTCSSFNSLLSRSTSDRSAPTSPASTPAPDTPTSPPVVCPALPLLMPPTTAADVGAAGPVPELLLWGRSLLLLLGRLLPRASCGLEGREDAVPGRLLPLLLLLPLLCRADSTSLMSTCMQGRTRAWRSIIRYVLAIDMPSCCDTKEIFSCVAADAIATATTAAAVTDKGPSSPILFGKRSKVVKALVSLRPSQAKRKIAPCACRMPNPTPNRGLITHLCQPDQLPYELLWGG